MSEAVTITAEDGVRIAGVFDASTQATRAAILVHMMPATKESFAAFQEKLTAAGIASLAIDLRGHGESDGGPTGYRRFSDAEQQTSIRDLTAGVAFLEKRGFSLPNITVVGASIGANLALQFAAAHPDVRTAMALSPGLDYRGVLTMPAAVGLQRTQRIYLAASRDDAESDAAVEKLAEVSLARTTVRHFDRAGHGSTMLERELGFMDELIIWINTKP